MTAPASLPENALIQSDCAKSRLDRFAIALFLVVMGAGVLLAAWLLVQEGAKRAVIADLSRATRAGDIHRLSQAVDWISVRNSLKRDLRARGIAVTPEQVDHLVNAYASPASLPGLLATYRARAGAIDPAAFVRSAQFSGLNEITIALAPPPQLDKPWLSEVEPVRAIFILEPKGWTLKALSAPGEAVKMALADKKL